MQQLTTGIYLSEVCLIGLFAIGVGSSTQSVGPLVLMIVFLVVTIAWHIWLNRTLSKLEIQLSRVKAFTSSNNTISRRLKIELRSATMQP